MARNIAGLEGKNATITGWGKFFDNLQNVLNKEECGASACPLLVGKTPINNNGCKEDETLKTIFDEEVHICAGDKGSKNILAPSCNV